MNFGQIYGKVLDQSDMRITDNQAKTFVNEAFIELCADVMLPFNRVRGWFRTVAAYSTGTVDVTNGSKTVSGTGTTFTEAMVGRRFSADEQSFYTVAAYVSGTEITLEEPFTQDTDTEKSYKIDQDTYLLSWRCAAGGIEHIYQQDKPTRIFPLSEDALISSYPSRNESGDPEEWNQLPPNNDEWTYSTGTVTGTSGTVNLTGSGTRWMDAESKVAPDSKITIDGTDYYIKKIKNQAEIVLYEALQTSPSGAAYTITTNYPFQRVQLLRTPDDEIIIWYDYHYIAQEMIDDEEFPWPIPMEHHLLIQKLALFKAFDYDNTNDSQTKRKFDLFMKDYRVLTKKSQHRDSPLHKKAFDGSTGPSRTRRDTYSWPLGGD